jgi:Ca-activated chloride channel family protein
MEFEFIFHPTHRNHNLKFKNMKQKTLFMTLLISGIASIATLSSFYKGNNNEQMNDEGIEYNSNSKQQVRKGNLTLSTSFENDYYSNQNRFGHFYAEVQTDRYRSNYDRHTPLNLSIVIDRSGSMAGDKIRNTKLAAKQIVDQMSSDDYLSIVIYDNQIEVLQPATRVVNKQTFKNMIDRIQDRGGTNLMGGALKGYQEVKKNYRTTYVNRVLLLSDGLANEGITNSSEIERIVRRKSIEEGISISTFGVGNDYNENLMTGMAESGTGNYYFIDHSEKIAGILKKELKGLMDVVAQNVELKITIPEFVNIEKVYGLRYEQNGRTLTLKLHDLFSEETKGVLIKYSVNRNINSTVRFATSLSYFDVANNRTQQIRINNQNEFTTNAMTFNNHYSEWVASQVALYESNERLEQAMEEVDKGNYEQARKIVKENKVYMKSKAPLVQKSVELQRAESTNSSYDSKIENVEAMPMEDVKYLQKASKSANYQLRTKKK